MQIFSRSRFNTELIRAVVVVVVVVVWGWEPNEHALNAQIVYNFAHCERDLINTPSE
jgi:hypothetical protein